MEATLQWIDKACSEVPLTEKWILASEMRIAQLWKERFLISGRSSVNLQGVSLRSLTLALSAPLLASASLSFADTVDVDQIVESCLTGRLRSGDLSYLGSLTDTEDPSRYLARSLSDLRLAEIAPEQLDASAFVSREKTLDLKLLYSDFVDQMASLQVTDLAGCIRLLIQSIQARTTKLPDALRILIPEQMEFTALESQLVKQLAQVAEVSSFHGRDNNDQETSGSNAVAPARSGSTQLELDFEEKPHVHFLHGVGEANELRAVLRNLFSTKSEPPARLDAVEILYTDYQTYVPLIHETLSGYFHRLAADSSDKQSDQPPITFSEGVASIYARPGKALRSWLRWLRADCPQSKATEILREGLFRKPENGQHISYSVLANSLRRIPIGFGAERYLPKIDEAIQSAKGQQKAFEEHGDHEHGKIAEKEHPRDFGLAALETLRAIFSGILELAPSPEEPEKPLFAKALQFLDRFARQENRQDRVCSKLLNDVITARLQSPIPSHPPVGLWSWLENLPLNTRMHRSGPTSGCLHVAPLRQGGYSGRSRVFIMGLDESRFPAGVSADPFLLDLEREQLDPQLPTNKAKRLEQQNLLPQVFSRLATEPEMRVCLTFSNHNLQEDRSLYPSTELLEAFRNYVDPKAEQEDFLRALGPSDSFSSLRESEALDRRELQITALLGETCERTRQKLSASLYPNLACLSERQQRLSQSEFSAYDGFVPQAGPELDPTNPTTIQSASRLEAYGVCPRRFFFRYGLGVYPPDAWSSDPERWLDPLRFGTLMHTVFEEFLQEIAHQQRIPMFPKDLSDLQSILDQKVNEMKEEVPVSSRQAFSSQYEMLCEICEIFLRKEQEYCEKHKAVPWIMEASLGLDEHPRNSIDSAAPIPLPLSNGRVMQVAARIDRIDRLRRNNGEAYAIWDYKSGSSFGFRDEAALRSGRKIQPILYAGMLRHRLKSQMGPGHELASFGYFFPTPKAEGERIQWTDIELESHTSVLDTICDLIADGVFIATSNKDDCRFCDYNSVCENPEAVVELSIQKATDPANSRHLKAWRELRQLGD